MLTYGLGSLHNDRMDFIEPNDNWDPAGVCTMCGFIQVQTYPFAAQRCPVFGKHDGANGYGMKVGSTWLIQAEIDAIAPGGCNIALPAVGNTGSWGVQIDGANAIYFLDGAQKNTRGCIGTPTNTADMLKIGNAVNVGTGQGGLHASHGHIMVYKVVLIAAEIAIWHTGIQPNAGNLIVWTKQTSDPAVETQENVTGTKVGGDVNLLADPCDDYFVESGADFMLNISQWLGPVIGGLAATLGAGLKYEKVGPLWQHIQNHMGRCFPDLPYDDPGRKQYEQFLDFLRRRPVWNS